MEQGAHRYQQPRGRWAHRDRLRVGVGDRQGAGRDLSLRRFCAAIAAGLCALAGCASDGSPSADPAPTSDGPEQFTSESPPEPPEPLAARLCRGDEPVVVGRVADPELVELSGLATSPVSPGVLWAQQDSGTDPVLFAIDAGSGTALGRLLVNAPNVDWEDMATDVDGDLLIADTGDNQLRRSEVAVIAVATPSDLAAADGSEPSTTSVAYRYPDGPRDVEAMFVDPTNGDRYVMTKAFGPANLTIGDDTIVYRLDQPSEPGGTGTATEIARLQLGFALATGADMARDGSTLLVRTYGSVLVWHRPEASSVADMFREDPCAAPAPRDGQSEAIAFTDDGEGYFTASEGEHPQIWLVRADR